MEIEIIPDRKYGFAIELEKFYKGKDSVGTEGVIIEGYASTKDLDRGGDIVEPTAFADTLGEFMENPLITYMHDWGNPVGRVIAARITESGLWVRGFISKTATTAVELIKEGILRGFSIGYEIVEEKMVKDVRHILKLKLYEIAIVTIPMNAQTLFTVAKALRNGASPEAIKMLVKECNRRIKEGKYIEVTGCPSENLIEVVP